MFPNSGSRKVSPSASDQVRLNTLNQGVTIWFLVWLKASLPNLPLSAQSMRCGGFSRLPPHCQQKSSAAGRKLEECSIFDAAFSSQNRPHCGHGPNFLVKIL